MIEPSRGPLLDNGPMIRAVGLSVGVGRVGATNQADPSIEELSVLQFGSFQLSTWICFPTRFVLRKVTHLLVLEVRRLQRIRATIWTESNSGS